MSEVDGFACDSCVKTNIDVSWKLNRSKVWDPIYKLFLTNKPMDDAQSQSEKFHGSRWTMQQNTASDVLELNDFKQRSSMYKNVL